MRSSNTTTAIMNGSGSNSSRKMISCRNFFHCCLLLVCYSLTTTTLTTTAFIAITPSSTMTTKSSKFNHPSVPVVKSNPLFESTRLKLLRSNCNNDVGVGVGSAADSTLQSSIPSSTSSSSTSLHASKSNNSTPSTTTTSKQNTKKRNNADFEYQELKAQVQAMKDQDVTSSRLQAPKRIELEGYVRRIVNQRTDNSIPLWDMAQYLPNTQWRLAFSTESLLSETLPKDSTIDLKFEGPAGDNDNVGVGGKVEYSLNFPKTLALKRLVAKSSYTVSSSPVDAGLVRIEYESISTDVFGFSNIGVGMFGLLKGRSTFIPTVYFDDDIWIERGMNPTTGDEFYNVYAKVEDDDDN